MTTIWRWIFATPSGVDDQDVDAFVTWRDFRRSRAVIVRGLLLIVVAQGVLIFYGYHVGDVARSRIAAETRRADLAQQHASFLVARLNCLDIEAERATQRAQLRRTLKTYKRADVRKLLGPKLVAEGRRMAFARLASLKPINCRQRAAKLFVTPGARPR